MLLIADEQTLSIHMVRVAQVTENLVIKVLHDGILGKVARHHGPAIEAR